MKTLLNTIKADFKRYRHYKTGQFEWYEYSIICVFLYRIGRYIREIKFKPIIIFLNLFYTPVFVFFSMLLGIQIPRGAIIGPGLKIYHFGTININPLAKIGKNCTLRPGVTVGNRGDVEDVPEIGDDVDFGVGSIVIGKIKIGNNVSIGANALVLCDVPDNHIAIGVPAKVLIKKEFKVNLS